jgi:heat shock protein HslJ
MNRAVAPVVAAAVGLLMVGVAAGQGSTSLVGPTWQLAKLAGVSRDVTSVTATFTSDSKVSGFSGCNQYSGSYTTSGSSISIAKPVAATMMACGPAPTLLERAYLKALGAARHYAISGSKLTLKSRLGLPVATFAVQSQSVVGTRWTVLSYNNGKQAVVSVMAGTSLTANFDAKGNLSGFGGCNEYSADVKATPPKITIGPVASTRKSCSNPAGVMDQETAYLAALSTAATYLIQGSKLELRTASGAIAAEFTRAA